MKSVMALEAIWWPLRPFRGSQSYTKAIRGHFYCKNALFHWPFWCLGTTGNHLKIILGEFLEPGGHVKFFLETALDGKGTKFSVKNGDFGPFWGSAGYLNVDRFGSNLKSWGIRDATTPVKSIFVGTITYKAIPANLPKLVKFYRFSPMWTYCRTTTILGT